MTATGTPAAHRVRIARRGMGTVQPTRNPLIWSATCTRCAWSSIEPGRNAAAARLNWHHESAHPRRARYLTPGEVELLARYAPRHLPPADQRPTVRPHTPDPVAIDHPDAGEVFSYGRPVAWGALCWSCEAPSYDHPSRASASVWLNRHHASRGAACAPYEGSGRLPA